MGHPLLDLTNKTAVVIGGTSGIGLALTKALAQAGAEVVPSSRRAEQVRSAVSEVESLGRQVWQRSDPGELRRSHQTGAHARIPRV